MLGEQDNYEGAELAARCRNGPLQERTCTDWFCCFIYLALIVFIIFLAFFAGSGARQTWAEVELQLK